MAYGRGIMKWSSMTTYDGCRVHFAKMKRGIDMSRRRSVMSESFKSELAKDLGFYDVVQREGWSGIRTKDAGNMVKRAIQIAEAHLASSMCHLPLMLRLLHLTTVSR